MNWATLSAILSAIGQLPTAALIAITCVLSGIGIGAGMAFRDIPKYFHKTVVAILNFILRLKGKEQIDIPVEQNEGKNNDETRIIEIIEGGKAKKKGDHTKTLFYYGFFF